MSDITVPPRGMRAKSVRALREHAGMYRRWAIEGRISWSDYHKAMAGLKAEGELLLGENLLGMQGGDREAPAHPEGDLGGFDVSTETPKAPRAYVRRKVTVKEGRDGRGFPVDEKRITYEDGGPEPAEGECAAGELIEADPATLAIADLM